MLLAFFTTSTIRWLLAPRSDLIRSDAYSVHYRSDEIERNTRYSNQRQTIGWHFLGFEFEMSRLVSYALPLTGKDTPIEWGPVITWNAAVPGWACIALSAILPARWVVIVLRRRRAGRIRAGICLRCGYDLRASPGRCPECGEQRPRADGTISSASRAAGG